MIAEESTSWPGVTAPTSSGGLGFGFKWNMGWMHDTLQYIQKDPMYRAHHHDRFSRSSTRSASTSCCRSATTRSCTARVAHPQDAGRPLAAARERARLSYMWAHPGKQLLFMGQEFGQLSEWSEARTRLVDPRPAHHKQLAEFVGALNRTYRETAALWQLDDDSSGFEWVEGGAAAENVIAFLRYDRERRPLLCVVNFAGRPHEGFRLGLPRAAAGARC